MHLYLLRRINDVPMYDVFNGHIVRAEDKEAARLMAAKRAADEGAEVWFDAKQSECREITVDGEPGVLLSDFNAG